MTYVRNELDLWEPMMLNLLESNAGSAGQPSNTSSTNTAVQAPAHQSRCRRPMLPLLSRYLFVIMSSSSVSHSIGCQQGLVDAPCPNFDGTSVRALSMDASMPAVRCTRSQSNPGFNRNHQSRRCSRLHKSRPIHRQREHTATHMASSAISMLPRPSPIGILASIGMYHSCGRVSFANRAPIRALPMVGLSQVAQVAPSNAMVNKMGPRGVRIKVSIKIAWSRKFTKHWIFNMMFTQLEVHEGPGMETDIAYIPVFRKCYLWSPQYSLLWRRSWYTSLALICGQNGAINDFPCCLGSFGKTRITLFQRFLGHKFGIVGITSHVIYGVASRHQGQSSVATGIGKVSRDIYSYQNDMVSFVMDDKPPGKFPTVPDTLSYGRLSLWSLICLDATGRYLLRWLLPRQWAMWSGYALKSIRSMASFMLTPVTQLGPVDQQQFNCNHDAESPPCNTHNHLNPTPVRRRQHQHQRKHNRTTHNYTWTPSDQATAQSFTLASHLIIRPAAKYYGMYLAKHIINAKWVLAACHPSKSPGKEQ